MRKILLIAFLAFNLLHAQNVDIKSVIIKADSYQNNREYDKGIKYVQGVIKKNLYEGELWDKLIEFYQIKNGDPNKINLTIKDLNTKNIQKILLKALERPDYYKMIHTARWGVACGYGSTWCDIILRKTLVDHVTDTAVSDSAVKLYEMAEKEFVNRNFEKAIKNYKKAIEIEPNYYHANLYLGDTYYAMKDYKNAIPYFQKSIEAQPDLLEPRKFLVDAYLESDAYELALKECINGICVFPDFSMMIKLYNVHDRLGNKFRFKRLVRTALPKGTTLSKKLQKDVLIITPEKNSVWNLYLTGLENFRNQNGENEIVYNDKTNKPLQYCEIEAWKYMIKNTSSTYLDDARKFDQDGYLDCYIMIDNFHIDFYEQYKVWVKENKPRIETYLTTYRVK